MEVGGWRFFQLYPVVMEIQLLKHIKTMLFTSYEWVKIKIFSWWIQCYCKKNHKDINGGSS